VVTSDPCLTNFYELTTQLNPWMRGALCEMHRGQRNRLRVRMRRKILDTKCGRPTTHNFPRVYGFNLRGKNSQQTRQDFVCRIACRADVGCLHLIVQFSFVISSSHCRYFASRTRAQKSYRHSSIAASHRRRAQSVFAERVPQFPDRRRLIL
jgi:hypothetical protein